MYLYKDIVLQLTKHLRAWLAGESHLVMLYAATFYALESNLTLNATL